MMEYKWKYDHVAGPLSLVMSHDHTWVGAVAISSGLTRGGCVASSRRSPVSPWARSSRYIVATEQR